MILKSGFVKVLRGQPKIRIRFEGRGAKKQSFGELRYLVSSDRMAQSVIKQTNRSC